ncbi:hypothetical protein [Amycolatopsis sp. DSM 110486]|uniref:hypothetical protein n=1 Tax=Amycolatopsis sp. DSM 110486 TaxID=2865832 RepID=UPI0021039498|nr:hypothetical protein [Amycolatopsis sp. DSM 110486]
MRKTIVSVVLAAFLLAAAGCGAADAPGAQIAAQAFVTAAATGAAVEACALLAPRARDTLGPAECPPVLPEVPRAPVVSASVWGDEAQARSAADTLFLHEFPDGWRITGAGCHLRNEQVYDCAIGGR